MSCPGGCNNGGGQARADGIAQQQQLPLVDGMYLQVRRLGGREAGEAGQVRGALRGAGEEEGALRTRFRAREKSMIAVVNDW